MRHLRIVASKAPIAPEPPDLPDELEAAEPPAKLLGQELELLCSSVPISRTRTRAAFGSSSRGSPTSTSPVRSSSTRRSATCS